MSNFKKECDKNLISQQVEAVSAAAGLLERAQQHRAPTLLELEKAEACIRLLINLKYLERDERIDEALARIECDIDDLRYKYRNT